MKSFKQFCENKQEDLVNRIINNLCYSSGVCPDEIVKLDSKSILELLNQNKLIDGTIDPLRLVAMIKIKARLINSGEELSPSNYYPDEVL